MMQINNPAKVFTSSEANHYKEPKISFQRKLENLVSGFTMTSDMPNYHSTEQSKIEKSVCEVAQHYIWSLKNIISGLKDKCRIMYKKLGLAMLTFILMFIFTLNLILFGTGEL